MINSIKLSEHYYLGTDGKNYISNDTISWDSYIRVSNRIDNKISYLLRNNDDDFIEN